MTVVVEREERISFQQLVVSFVIATVASLGCGILVSVQVEAGAGRFLFYISSGVAILASAAMFFGRSKIRPHATWKRFIYRSIIMIGGSLCAPFAFSGLTMSLTFAGQPFSWLSLVWRMTVAFAMVLLWVSTARWGVRYAALSAWQQEYRHKRYVRIPRKNGAKRELHKDDVRESVRDALMFLRYVSTR